LERRQYGDQASRATKNEGKDIDINDVAAVIRYGRIMEHSKPIQHWRYTILGKAVDGERVKCVVEINGKLIIVTVI
jgi:hypothetical protein